MSSETNTLLSREETPGRRYPLFVERLLLILVVPTAHLLARHDRIIATQKLTRFA